MKYLIILLALITLNSCELESPEYEITVTLEVEYLDSKIDTVDFKHITDLEMVTAKGMILKENGSLCYAEQHLFGTSYRVISNGVRSYNVINSNVTQIK